MARPLRVEFEGASYHITSRGNAAQSIFLAECDREDFLDVLAATIIRFGWACHAYCLMPDHYHLAIETPQANLSGGMRYLNWTYTQAFNRRYLRSGHLLEGRYEAILVEKGPHLLDVARHVVLNPVRAEMARSAKDWPWSSYRATAGLAEAPSYLTTDWILSQFGNTPSRAAALYRDYVKRGRKVNVWDTLRNGVLFGSDAFVERFEPSLSPAHPTARASV